MARDLPERDERQSTVTTETSRQHSDKTGLLHRRGYLKLAAAAAATAGLAGQGSAASDDSDVVTLDPGERRVVRLDDGETFENVIFDQRAAGAAATIVADGTNWTIRNVAFRGEFGHRGRALGVADTGGGTSRIENVYMGDGVEAGIGDRRHPQFGIWVSPEHAGHIDFDRIYVEGAHDNAFYASAPGSNANGRRGTVRFRNCYAKDNWVAGFRLSRGVVDNCVAVNTPAGRDGRPLWVWNTDEHDGRVEVYDSDFVAGDYPYAMDIGRDGGRCEIYVEGTQWRGEKRHHPGADVRYVDGGGNGTNATDRVPEGCPTSVDEVFAGSNTITAAYDHTIELAGQFGYRLEVDGEIVPASASRRYLSRGEAYGDDWAEWWLSGSEDARTTWHYTGEITSLDVSPYDGATDVRSITIDGESVDPSRFDDRPARNTLEIAGQCRYRVEVDGEIEPAADHARWLTEGEAYGDDWAEWWLSGSADARTAWEFTGEITSLELTDYAGETAVRTLAVNGEELDRAAYVPDREHTLELAGQCRYRIDVDGEIEPAADHARWLTEGEAYGDDWAEWWLSGSEDARTVWEVTGEVTSLDVSPYDGRTDVRTLSIDGEPVDPARFD
ncbi:hypothetical protein [Halovivax cerinus]|uniref:Right handed beta helix domain-containing protein n=1 Tax=Halovivax cerinus TaxID=1487865 RepID=A0ABD5NP25_9EURY|nr:hypothetical protein [Halovivax cerinus]